MEFKKFTVTSSDFSKAILEWELEPTHEDLTNLKFEIFRGEDQIHASGIEELDNNTYIYEDPTFGDVWQDKLYNLYYYVKIGDTVSEAKGINSIDNDWVGREIMRRDKVYFENVIRTPFLWLKIKTSGQYCDNFDDALGQHLTPGDCEICYNTNWTGGYYLPYKIWGNLSSDTQHSQVTPAGVTNIKTARFVMSSFPEVSMNDIIISQHGDRWRVGMITGPESRASQFRQIFNLQAVDRGDPVYKMPIDFSLFNS